MESVRDNQVTIAQSSNATGKTHAAARIATWFYKCFPETQVYTTAAPPEKNLKQLLWGEIGSITEKHPVLFSDDKLNVLHIERAAKEFITGVTIPSTGTEAQREAKFSGKHQRNLLFIVDEGDAVPDEVYKGIEACMSGGNAKLLILFNPRSETGPVYRMIRDRRAHVVELSAFRHPNVVTGEIVIPGAVDREKTVRRINEWSRPLTSDETPDQECFEVPEFLVGCTAKSLGGEVYPPLTAGWRKIVDPALSYMVLARYPAQSAMQLISLAWINAARSRWDVYVAQNGEVPPQGVQPVQGLDVAEYGADSSISMLRYGGWVARPRKWNGIDPDATADRGDEIHQQFDALVTNVDGTGVGAGVAPKISRKGHTANSIKVAASPTYRTELGEFKILRDQLWWEVREWLRTDPGAMLPPDENLIEDLKTPEYVIIGGYIRVTPKEVLKERLKRSPDEGDALCLTFAPYEGGASILWA